MTPTLEPGDRVILIRSTPYLSLLSLRFSVGESGILHQPDFSIGDVIVLTNKSADSPASSSRMLVKRIAARARDTVFATTDYVSLGSTALDSARSFAVQYNMDYTNHESAPLQSLDNLNGLLSFSGPLQVPYKGMKLDLGASTIKRWVYLLEKEGHRVNFSNGIVYLDGNAAPTYTVQHDYYYVVGDNIKNSLDSRYWGFVRDDEILGTPVLIYWSGDPQASSFSLRWSRMFTLVH